MNSKTAGQESKSFRLHATVGMNCMLRLQPCPYVSTHFLHEEVMPRPQDCKSAWQYSDGSSTLGVGHGCTRMPTGALHVHACHEPAGLSSGVDVLTCHAALTAWVWRVGSISGDICTGVGFADFERPDQIKYLQHDQINTTTSMRTAQNLLYFGQSGQRIF